MKLKLIKRNLIRPILGSLIFHAIILGIFNIINIHPEIIEADYSIYIELVKKEVNLNNFKSSSNRVIKKKKKESVDRNNQNVYNKEFITSFFHDSIAALDTMVVIEDSIINTQSSKFDSLVVNNPSIMSLKYALSKQLNLENLTESDSAFIVRRLKQSVIDYYRIKYPTPLSKFGEPNQGIAIDDIIDLFKADDDIDTEKIKKYLGIE